jgi:hypothetical protein
MEILLFVDVRVAVNVTPSAAVDIRDNLQDIVFVGQVVVVQLMLSPVVIVPAVDAEGTTVAIGGRAMVVVVMVVEHTMMVKDQTLKGRVDVEALTVIGYVIIFVPLAVVDVSG